jgi:hypothetical protein
MNVQHPVLNYGDFEPIGIGEKINKAFDALSSSIQTLDDDLKHLELQRRADKTRITQLEQRMDAMDRTIFVHLNEIRALKANIAMMEQDANGSSFAIDPVTPELEPTGYEDVSNFDLLQTFRASVSPPTTNDTRAVHTFHELLRRLDRVID